MFQPKSDDFSSICAISQATRQRRELGSPDKQNPSQLMRHFLNNFSEVMEVAGW